MLVVRYLTSQWRMEYLFMDSFGQEENVAEILRGIRDGKVAKNRRPTHLKDALLTSQDLKEVDLSGLDLTGADLTGADLAGAKLFRSKLVNAALLNANLNDADLTGSDLTNANLEHVTGLHVGMGMATLEGGPVFSGRNSLECL